MSFESFFSDILSTVVGGLILALLFFVLKEKYFALPALTGRWHLEQTTRETAYKPYQGMVIRYVAMLWVEGNKVIGSAEKIYEKSSTGERAFIGSNRTRALVAGYIEKKYFDKDRVYLHVIEEGHGRESTTLYKLISYPANIFRGDFSSMVADQVGIVKLQCDPF